jgi:hypothetical protein
VLSDPSRSKKKADAVASADIGSWNLRNDYLSSTTPPTQLARFRGLVFFDNVFEDVEDFENVDVRSATSCIDQ